MMKTKEFIGRNHELNLLNKEYQKDSSFVLLTGRRRIGKTRLLKEFIKDKDALYFFTNRNNGSLLLNEFSESVSSYCGIPSAEYRNWKDVFDIFVRSKDGKKILIIDEFQNMIYSDDSLVSQLQDIWDNILSQSEIMLILCGSHISVMESQYNDYNGPLYGRFTRHITLDPLNFDDIADNDFVESVKRYAIHGGVPKYMELMGDGDLEDIVRDEIMDPSSVMFEDPNVLMSDEVKNAAGYMAILKAISNGNHRVSEIASYMQVPVTSLSHPLERLMEMRLIRRDVPVTDSELKNKNGRYVFVDNYTSFWFRFVYPFQSSLIIGESDGAIESWKLHFNEHHVSFVFEELCRRSVFGMSKYIGFVPRKVGRYWNKNNIEIDIVALDNDGKNAFVAECKFRSNKPVDLHDLNSLKSKCMNLKELKGYNLKYGLFSVSGFSDSLFEEDVILWDKGIMQ